MRQCSSCGEEIPAIRLKAKPGATLCVSCQGQAETNISDTSFKPAYHLSILSVLTPSHRKSDEGQIGHAHYMKGMARAGYFATAVA